MANNKIKVMAPADNPHICYLDKEMEQSVRYVKKHTGKSLYKIICESAGHSLRTKGDIHAFKEHLRRLGWKTIGDWVTEMLNRIIESGDFENIPKPTRKEKTDDGVCN
jgi:hypothetical protein